MKAILGLEIDDGETIGAELGFEALESVIYSIPDTKENSALFAALAKHPYPGIRAQLASKQNLDDETIMLLASDTDMNVLCNVTYSESFKSMATLDDIKRILEQNNDASMNIISSAGSFKKVSVDEIEQTIKEVVKNPRVLQVAAQAYEMTNAFLEELSQNPDVSVSSAAKETLKNR